MRRGPGASGASASSLVTSASRTASGDLRLDVHLRLANARFSCRTWAPNPVGDAIDGADLFAELAIRPPRRRRALAIRTLCATCGSLADSFAAMARVLTTQKSCLKAGHFWPAGKIWPKLEPDVANAGAWPLRPGAREPIPTSSTRAKDTHRQSTLPWCARLLPLLRASPR